MTGNGEIRKEVILANVAFYKEIAAKYDQVSAGDLAEYHARTGLDDRSLGDALRGLGFSVSVEHYPVGRTKLALWCNRQLHALRRFKIVARRESVPVLEN